MSGSRARTAYLFETSLRRFLERNAGRCLLLTLTFQENITDKREAERRFKPVKDWLVARGFEGLGVWQRQRRGAWHLHLVVSNGKTWSLSICELRAFAVERGWGSFINIERIRPTIPGEHLLRVGDGWRDVVRYLGRYLTRDMGADVSRVRLVTWLGQSRVKVGNTKFSWVSGAARAWRLGCEELAVMISALCGGLRPGWQWRWREEIMAAGWAELERRNLAQCLEFFSGMVTGRIPP